MSDNPTVSVDQLRIGLYVYLDLRWFDHPFAFSHFKIKSEEQIKTIRGLGLGSVRYSPELSDINSPDSTRSPMVDEAPAAEPSAFIQQALEAKRAMMERIKVQREAAARIENAFIDSAKTVREVEKNLFAQPAETLRQASKLVTQIADSILCAPELAIHVMGDKMGGEELYFHSLNVTTLAMMMARDIKLPQEAIGTLGMGALFHDIGRKEIPNRILMKLEPLTQAERHLYEMHCQYGFEIGQRLQFSPGVLAIIRDHHEMFDGSGYPQKLQGEKIGLLARIVGLANHYDGLCNPINIADALTPHEALSLMFAKLRNKFDPKLLQVFIRCLGVYPPGTIVQLSNSVIGMIATVNTAKPMKPMIVIYDANVPKEEAILVDLERETDLSIAKAIRPAQVPGEVYNYLSPRKRVSYYFDGGQSGQEKVSP
jgi:putative nucleotidyltransferase with HDIG domain